MQFDIAIIGAGQAGVPLAEALAGQGRSVAMIERSHLGGSCVNFGCTPSKALIGAAGVAHAARDAARFGVLVPEVGVDFPAVMRRVRDIVKLSTDALHQTFDGSRNPLWIKGQARLDGRDGALFRVAVGERIILARDVVLDTGTRSAMPGIDGLETIDPITAGNWVSLDVLPKRLLILGGSYIALEFGQAFARLGAEVVILQDGDGIAQNEDQEVSDAILSILRDEGLDVRLGVSVDRVEKTATGVRLWYGDESVEGSHLLVATGRRPNTDDLGLETVGVKHDERGTIETDHRLSTSVEGIWAAGDIRGGPAFTHTAYADSKVLENHIAGDRTATNQGRIVPYALFVAPELGRVGMTETQARAAGHSVRVGVKQMHTSGKAREIGQTLGFIKVVIDRDTDLFLGASCLCHGGSDVVQIFIALMNAGATAHAILNSVVIHPTIGEAAKNAVVDAYAD